MKALESIWTPTQKQSIALACPAYELMYGGAKGGGKTDFLLFDHVNQHLLAHRHWEEKRIKSTTMALLLRKEFGRLKDLIQRSHTYFPILSEGAMTWKEAEHTWYCACGYRVWFGHCEGPQDHELYQGQEIGHLGVDQGEELPFHQYAYIKLQVRTSHAYLEPTLAVRVTANPGGRYGAWVKKRFVDPNRKGMTPITEAVEIERNGTKTTITKERVFIPAFLWDNPHLSVGYEAELRLAPEHMRRAFLDGDWDVVEGSFFGDVFDASIHVIDDLGPTEIRIPSNWPVFRCADWGSRNPAACYWVTVDNDGLLVVLDELYGPGETPDRWAKRVLQVEEAWGWTEKPRGWDDKRVSVSKLSGVLDPSCFKDDVSGGPKISTQLFEAGLLFYEGDNERKPGWVELRRRLMERGGASKKIPGLRIARRCTNLIRTLPNLTSGDPDKGGDLDDINTKQDDHACFVPSTMIQVPGGVCQLGDLDPRGGLVIGPSGPERYSSFALTRRSAETVFVSLSDGSEIQCTPDHRFLSREGKWIEASNLIQGQSFTLAGSGGATADTGKIGREGSFTGRSGPTKLGRFRAGSISTTSTETAMTIGSRIWSVFLGATMPWLTEATRAGRRHVTEAWRRPAPSPWPSQPVVLAGNAGLFSLLGFATELESTSVPTSVRPLTPIGGASTKRLQESARSAVTRSKTPEASGQGRPAGTNAAGPYVVRVRSAPRADVYCVYIPGSHAFALASGVIVHNCDALRYGVMSRPRGRVESEMDDAELKNWERVMMRQAQTSADARNPTTGY